MKLVFIILLVLSLSVCYAQEVREMDVETVNASVYVELNNNANYDFLCSEIIMDSLIQRNRYAGSAICVVYVFYPDDGYTWCIPFNSIKSASKFIGVYREITRPCEWDNSKEEIAKVNERLTNWFNSLPLVIGHSYDTNSKGEKCKIRYCKTVR